MATAYLHSESGFDIGNTGLSGFRKYIVTGATDDEQAYVAARDKAIAEGFATYFGIPVGSVSGRHLGGDVYHVDVKYDPAARTEAAASVGGATGGSPETEGGADQMGREWSLSTAGGTRHIVRSLKTVSTHVAPPPGGVGPPAPAPDFKQLIGVSEGGIEGVDILAPEPVITVKRKLKQMTLSYFLFMCHLTGTTNIADWKGIKREDLLFGGMNADYRDGDGWNATWTFRYSSTNLEEIKVGAGIVVPVGQKAGHHYLWAAYRKQVDSATGYTISIPIAAYIEQVYYATDFNLIGI